MLEKYFTLWVQLQWNQFSLRYEKRRVAVGFPCFYFQPMAPFPLFVDKIKNMVFIEKKLSLFVSFLNMAGGEFGGSKQNMEKQSLVD